MYIKKRNKTKDNLMINKAVLKKENLMAGFLGYISLKPKVDKLEEQQFFESRTISKFEKDKCCAQNEEFVVVIEGALLNLQKLLSDYSCTSIFDLAIEMYKKSGIEFFKEFRGNFSGYFSDLKNEVQLVFVDHMGGKPLFYKVLEDERMLVGSRIPYVIEMMKMYNYQYSLDLAGAYSLLTYGHMYHDYTLIEGVKKLVAGQYILIIKGKISVQSYYQFNHFVDDTLTEDVALQEIDRLFTKSVQNQQNKNKEYGYLDVAPLSGGLDSRMTNYVLKKLTDSPILNITFSEVGQPDARIAEKIASELQNQWIFKNQCEGDFLYQRLEESIEIGEGLLYYIWPAQILDTMELLNLNNMGIIHTGMLGDVILGTFFGKTKDKKQNATDREYELGDGAMSTMLLPQLKEVVEEIQYANYETGMLYNRGINGACLGNTLSHQKYSELMSPFMDVELVDFMLKIPRKYRMKNNIYYKWVNKYYPAAAKHSHNGFKIPSYKYPEITVGNRKINIESIPSRIRIAIEEKKNLRYGMAPLEAWYHSNETIKNTWNIFFKENIHVLNNYLQLKEDVRRLYRKGTVKEKSLAITLVATVKSYFS